MTDAIKEFTGMILLENLKMSLEQQLLEWVLK